MADDWRGEDKISAKPRTHAERVTNNLSAASSLGHRKRRLAGCNMSKSGGPWAVSIARWHRSRKIGGDGLA